MVTTILSHPFFLELLLPAILVFTVIFAILQKSEILGKGKIQIDAIVSLVIALIVIAFARATEIIANLMPVLAVTVVAILVFLIIAGVAHSGKMEYKGMNIAIMVIGAIVVLVALLYYTGAWSYLKGVFEGKSSDVITTVVFALIIAAALFVVIKFSGKAEGK